MARRSGDAGMVMVSPDLDAGLMRGGAVAASRGLAQQRQPSQATADP